MEQALAEKKKSESVKYAARVVAERRMKMKMKMIERHEDEKKGSRGRSKAGLRRQAQKTKNNSEMKLGLRWKKKRHKRLRRAPLLPSSWLRRTRDAIRTTCQITAYRTTRDSETRSFESKVEEWWFEEIQGISELDVLEDLLQECQWSNSIREDILRTVALSERETGQQRFERITGGPERDVQIRLVSKDEAVQRRKKTPPTMMRVSPVMAVPCTTRRREAGELEKSKKFEDVKKENLKMKADDRKNR